VSLQRLVYTESAMKKPADFQMPAANLGTTSGTFRVVWVGREGTPRVGEVGVEYGGEIAEILGINFPDQTPPVK
jgi:hypothetical protein